MPNDSKLLNNMDHSEGNPSNITGDISYPVILTEINIDSVNHSLNLFLVSLSTYEAFYYSQREDIEPAQTRGQL